MFDFVWAYMCIYDGSNVVGSIMELEVVFKSFGRLEVVHVRMARFESE